MLHQVLSDYENYIIDEREIIRGGKSYTIDTVNSISDEYKNYKLYLIIGVKSTKINIMDTSFSNTYIGAQKSLLNRFQLALYKFKDDFKSIKAYFSKSNISSSALPLSEGVGKFS